jgi:release factor glutamine methyltransferase
MRAVDRSAPALAVARANGERLGLAVQWLQGPAVRALLAAAGFDEVGTRHDLSALPRCSAGKWAR